MSGPSEGSKGNFILQHIMKDNHNHVSLDPHMYFILQSSTSRSSKGLCMKSNKCSPLSLFLPRTFCRWKKDEPREYLQKRHYPCNLLKGKDPSLTANLVLIKRIFRPVFANYVGKLIFYFFLFFLQPMLVDSTIKWL